jgi:hypothetical protein
MALSPVRSESDWSAEILEAAREFMNGELRVMKPGTPGTYDPATDEATGGTEPSVVIDWRPARAQHLRMPVETNDGNGWTSRRRYRFQCEILDGDPLIKKGLYVEYRGGKDPVLAEFAFQVVSAVNSSHAALRTIETITEAAPA